MQQLTLPSNHYLCEIPFTVVIALFAMMWVSSTEDAQAQLQLKAPGQTESLYMGSNGFEDAWTVFGDREDVHQHIGKPYRFIYNGIEAYADADDVPGFFSWGGRTRSSRIDLLGLSVELGWWQFWGTVNNECIGPITFFTTYLNNPGSSPIQMYWDQAKVYDKQDVIIGWHGKSNCRDIDGYWEILGSIQEAPKPPTGDLTFNQKIYREGVSPLFQYEVERDELPVAPPHPTVEPTPLLSLNLGLDINLSDDPSINLDLGIGILNNNVDVDAGTDGTGVTYTGVGGIFN